MSHRYAQVAINAPLSQLFDYRFSADTQLECGYRVSVPFGRRKLIGIVMGLSDNTDVDAASIKNIDAVIDQQAVFNENDLRLIRFASDYYQQPIGEVAAAALPTALRQGKPIVSKILQLSVTEAGHTTDLEVLGKRAPRQAKLLACLSDDTTNTAEALDDKLPGWRRSRKALLEKGLISECWIDQDTETAVASVISNTSGPVLNADQSRALQTIRNKEGFAVTLLDGVTGSGKTEVYIRLIEEQLAAGQQTLILVPEIGLTPQLVRRMRDRLGIEPVAMHSGLNDSERLQAWRQAYSGHAKLIIGTRSAVFVPLPNAGLIIVDEEHDTSLKQQEGFRYSARDLAITRAKFLDIPIVLGTATPSLESLQHCRDENFQYADLPSRAGKAVAPRLRLVDLNRHPVSDGLSEPALQAIKQHLAEDRQVLVYINRRGFAPTLICSGCGHIAECDRCDSRMTVHVKENRLRCHHCGSERVLDTTCPHCHSSYRPLGEGTERLEQCLQQHFEHDEISRIDSDSTRLKGTMHRALERATRGESKILVGTQMLSKGHHFPNLTLVVIVNADQGLFSTDFRGSERLAQSLVQVSGRAGREERQGEVIIQTAFPDDPFWPAILRDGYSGFARHALAERQRAAWPPFSRLALIRASAAKREHALQILQHARTVAQNHASADIRILGPVSAPMERIAGQFRQQLLLQSVDRRSLHTLLKILRSELESHRPGRRARWSIDIDPIELF